jgi:putative phage-type endonuclease
VLIHDIEQRSDAWRQIRCGLPTASAFSNIVTSRGEESKSLAGYAYTLAAEKYAGKPVDEFAATPYMERGREMEAQAIAFYEFMKDMTVTPVGFVTDDSRTEGCSPDGLVGDDGLLEIKCLKAKNHVETILYHQKHGRCPTDYVQQTQGQLMICGRAWADLVFFHPDLPLLVIRQEPDGTFHTALRRGLMQVRAERDRAFAALVKMQPQSTILGAA